MILLGVPLRVQDALRCTCASCKEIVAAYNDGVESVAIMLDADRWEDLAKRARARKTPAGWEPLPENVKVIPAEVTITPTSLTTPKD